MKRFVSLKTIAVIAAASVAFAAPASAIGPAHHHDHHMKPGEALMFDIIGGVLEGAIAQEEEKEFERRCRRWYKRCENGSDYACDKYYNRCDD